ncbi:gametocyte-specific factor 1-like [Sitodiplosis mosellana]|uniref:gametocyte-specific factor 1-like n=1 Tax=Sitodiplosis mosellana TaxID=263140 RepID=UPI00244418FC|nr:gametocyte-specific factor 1-like [Sitodiplosis mosellana]
MNKLPGYGDTVICPYNKCHVIMKSRIQTHLIKCAKQHPEIQLETCPFDVTHKFRPEDKNAHIDECPSRENFDRYVYSVSTNNAKETTETKPSSKSRRTHNNDDEDWE